MAMSGDSLNILVVDDEPPLRQTLKRSFFLEGHRVVEVATGKPEQVAAVAGSYTGRFLEKIVEPAPARRRRSAGRAKVPAAA